MNFSPSPIQTLFLWRLLATEGSEFLKKIKPEVDAKERKALESAGLIAVEKRKESDKKGARASMFIRLTEQGWDWAATHLDADFSKTLNAAPVLHAILCKLKSHLERSGMSLADFMCPPEVNPPKSKEAGSATSQLAADSAVRVRAAYCQASGGRWNVRVRLADLRRLLFDVPRDALDTTLLQMEREGSLVLYPLDDPQEVRPEDESAGLRNTLGILRHIVYIER